MDDSVHELIFTFWCGHFQRQQWVYHVTASWVPYRIPGTHYVIRSSLLCGVMVLPAQILFRSTASRGDLRKKMVPLLSTVAHAVRGVFYSVVANRRQPNLYFVYI